MRLQSGDMNRYLNVINRARVIMVCTTMWSVIHIAYGVGSADEVSTVLASTNQQTTGATANIHDQSDIPYYVRLKELKRSATLDDVRRYLASPKSLDKYLAIQVINDRRDRTFLGDLSKALEDNTALVRVEAAITLAALNEPKGVTALVNEMGKARQLQAKLISEKVQRFQYADIDALDQWAHGAGALANLGNSSGYDVLKTNLLYISAFSCKMHSAIELPKFIRFKDSRIDARLLLLTVADDAVSRIDKCLEDNPTVRPSAQIGYFHVISQVLAVVGGTQEVAKLEQYSKHKDADVRRRAAACLHALERQGTVIPQQ